MNALEHMHELLAALELALLEAGWWGDASPDDAALASTEPFCVDTKARCRSAAASWQLLKKRGAAARKTPAACYWSCARWTVLSITTPPHRSICWKSAAVISGIKEKRHGCGVFGFGAVRCVSVAQGTLFKASDFVYPAVAVGGVAVLDGGDGGADG